MFSIGYDLMKIIGFRCVKGKCFIFFFLIISTGSSLYLCISMLLFPINERKYCACFSFNCLVQHCCRVQLPRKIVYSEEGNILNKVLTEEKEVTTKLALYSLQYSINRHFAIKNISL
jgi:hypothetical protein